MVAGETCGFCGRQGEEDVFDHCALCGAAKCSNCPPVCCETLISEYVDGWLQGLSEAQIERL